MATPQGVAILLSGCLVGALIRQNLDAVGIVEEGAAVAVVQADPHGGAVTGGVIDQTGFDMAAAVLQADSIPRKQGQPECIEAWGWGRAVRVDELTFASHDNKSSRGR